MPLLLDDSPSVIAVFREPLESACSGPWRFVLKDDQLIGQLVTEMTNEEQAFFLIDAEMGTYMGMDIVEALLQVRPDAVCIGFSSSSKYEEPFLQAGAKGFVHKNIHDPHGTIERLTLLLRQLHVVA
jgi:DNA-binding NarL/FixJ family response regulator